MQDIETKSLWAQISGECIQGPMEGKRLTQLPAVHTTFAEFKAQYPDGLVLVKAEKGEQVSPYDSYFKNKEKLGMFGRVDTYTRLDGKEIIFGLTVGNAHVAVSEAYLADNGFAVSTITAPPSVITYDRKGKRVVAFLLDGLSAEQISGLVEISVAIGDIERSTIAFFS